MSKSGQVLPYSPLGPGTAQQAHLQSTLSQFEVVTVDGGLLADEKTWERVDRIVRCLGTYQPDLRIRLIAYGDKEQSYAQAFQRDLALAHSDIVTLPNRAQEHIAILAAAATPDSRSMGVGGKIGTGKRVLHLAQRSSKFIEPFAPPHGVVCYKFHKLVLGTGCPYDCSYCYLQLTFRITPYVRVYLNLDKLWAEMARLSVQTSRPMLLNSGELADSLALDPITGLVNETLQEMSKYKDISLLLLTKSCNTDHLKPIDTGSAIIGASLTTSWNAIRFEQGTAHPYDRIDALAKAQEKGYRVRCRIDPILCVSDTWEQDYEELLDYLFRRIRVEVITLGQPRFYPALLNIIAQRYPEEGQYYRQLAGARTSDHRQRAGNESRVQTYMTILDMIERKRGNNPVGVMVCKEDPEAFRRLKGKINPRRCNCLY